MDIIISIVKYLSTSLSPAELLVVICAIVISMFTGIKYTVKILSKHSKGGLGGLLLGGSQSNSDEMKQMSKQLERVLTSDDLDKKLASIHASIQKIIDFSEKEANNFQEKFHAISLMRQEIDTTHNQIQEDLEELRRVISQAISLSENNASALRTDMLKLSEILHRTISQLEKIDEFTRATVPEFRSYHKDLAAGIKDLSRDIALVERSIQIQINTSNNAVKLR